ncbi:MAG: preprotein translocase subunit SecY [Candidatus Bathyarchaeia archaeon]
MGRFLQFFKPISRLMPEVKAPEKRVGFQEKLFWTGIALVIYLIMSEIPLYGVPGGGGQGDVFFVWRVIFAAKDGTLMWLGIGPIVTAGLILQLLAGSGIVEVDFSKSEDKALYTAASKFFTIIMIIVQGLAYIIGGAIPNLGFTVSVLVFTQLLAASIIVMLLDELIQKGWGLGSGISLFIVAGITQTIFWSSFSPFPLGDGKYMGAILAFIQSALKGESLRNWFIRGGGYPDMLGFVTTIIIFLIVIYIEGMRIELPISYARARGFRGKLPLKLLYVSNIPVILTYAAFANVELWSRVIWSRFNKEGTNFFLNLLGTFNQTAEGVRTTGGLAYYVTTPRLENILQDPLRGVVYTCLVVALCIVFSVIWIEVGGMGAEKVAEQLIGSGMHIPGFRRSKRPIENLLSRYIPTLTILGGALVGLIASVSQFFGVFGSGMGILLCVSILYQYYQVLMQEQIQSLFPGLGRGLD